MVYTRNSYMHIASKERAFISHIKLVIQFVDCTSINADEGLPWKFQVSPANNIKSSSRMNQAGPTASDKRNIIKLSVIKEKRFCALNMRGSNVLIGEVKRQQANSEPIPG